MKKAHRDKKRSSGFALGSGTNKKFRFVKKMFLTHPNNLQLDAGR
jgi:hypothetical protein